MKVIFIGNRYQVLASLFLFEGICDVKIFALADSHLERWLIENKKNYEVFSLADKKKMEFLLETLEYDILVSNGCPFILSDKTLSIPGRIFLNVHPTVLPKLRGKTPLNGVFFNNEKCFGATMHFIDVGIDTGRIISQIKIKRTPDIDLGLVYYLSFKAEGLAFTKGFSRLVKSNFKYKGIKQKGISSYFNREEGMMILDPRNDSNELLIRKIRSFSIFSQGVILTLEGNRIIVFDAQVITNKYILNLFKNISVGEVALNYDGKILLRTKEGLLKINSYKNVIC